jgi:poly-beta-hydroxyalkanoate depolymerase
VSNATIPFHSLEDNDDIRDYLDYIHESLTYSALPAGEDQQDIVAVRQPHSDERAAVRMRQAMREEYLDSRDERY